MWAPNGQPRVVFGFTITGGKVVAIELIADPRASTVSTWRLDG